METSYDDEIKQYINEFKMADSIKKYLITGELPKAVKTNNYTNTAYINYDEPHNVVGESFINTTSYITENIKKSIVLCKNIEQYIKQDICNENPCPVCFSSITDTNYVLPPCGHKMCVSCFISNVKYNKHTGDCCAICRQKYIS